ncbi:hypothetical protein VOLCADRAFT_88130 [Volvox carteri f. nagariensis]|uniref:SF4 helicase domain-containing protein n=1 Tax=Volvox carteri f. nagariensis TaxID=3068 RepID=D8TNC9_VOLCA|nr:uncharacterized protein VOLCADRAFT_88130 [Volvox carteri f. nagariensis]EFJ50968.1 hypothetical protein VOLCADRAFT_88130 [Volvox carteri f. nagariensis]|eukprot:XP_002947980.1 hypothetical protein VOLCADRAFT_88130 [Volvox carteri f. nagariensis]
MFHKKLHRLLATRPNVEAPPPEGPESKRLPLVVQSYTGTSPLAGDRVYLHLLQDGGDATADGKGEGGDELATLLNLCPLTRQMIQALGQVNMQAWSPGQRATFVRNLEAPLISSRAGALLDVTSWLPTHRGVQDPTECIALLLQSTGLGDSSGNTDAITGPSTFPHAAQLLTPQVPTSPMSTDGGAMQTPLVPFHAGMVGTIVSTTGDMTSTEPPAASSPQLPAGNSPFSAMGRTTNHQLGAGSFTAAAAGQPTTNRGWPPPPPPTPTPAAPGNPAGDGHNYQEQQQQRRQTSLLSELRSQLADRGVDLPEDVLPGEWHRGLCPFCGGDEGREPLSFNLIVSEDAHFVYYRCWRSNKCGVEETVWAESVRRGLQRRDVRQAAPKPQDLGVDEGKREELDEDALAYFAARGIRPETLRVAGVFQTRRVPHPLQPGTLLERVVVYPYYKDGVLLPGAERVLWGLDQVAFSRVIREHRERMREARRPPLARGRQRAAAAPAAEVVAAAAGAGSAGGGGNGGIGGGRVVGVGGAAVAWTAASGRQQADLAAAGQPVVTKGAGRGEEEGEEEENAYGVAEGMYNMSGTTYGLREGKGEGEGEDLIGGIGRDEYEEEEEGYEEVDEYEQRGRADEYEEEEEYEEDEYCEYEEEEYEEEEYEEEEYEEEEYEEEEYEEEEYEEEEYEEEEYEEEEYEEEEYEEEEYEEEEYEDVYNDNISCGGEAEDESDVAGTAAAAGAGAAAADGFDDGGSMSRPAAAAAAAAYGAAYTPAAGPADVASPTGPSSTALLDVILVEDEVERLCMMEAGVHNVLSLPPRAVLDYHMHSEELKNRARAKSGTRGRGRGGAGGGSGGDNGGGGAGVSLPAAASSGSGAVTSYMLNSRTVLCPEPGVVGGMVRVTLALRETRESRMLAEELATELSRERCRVLRWPAEEAELPPCSRARQQLEMTWPAYGTDPGEYFDPGPDYLREDFAEEVMSQIPAMQQQTSLSYTYGTAGMPYVQPAQGAQLQQPSQQEQQQQRQLQREGSVSALRSCAGDVLLEDGREALRWLVDAARPYPVRGLVDVTGLWGELLQHWYGKEQTAAGVSTGWPGLDELYKVTPGELTVVTGVPNSGKSHWLDALAVQLASGAGWRIAFASFEKSITRHAQNLIELAAPRCFSPAPPGSLLMSMLAAGPIHHTQKPMFSSQGFPLMSPGEFQEALNWINEHFVLIRHADMADEFTAVAAAGGRSGPAGREGIPAEGDAADEGDADVGVVEEEEEAGGPRQPCTIDWVLARATQAVYRYGIRGLVIDPYNELEQRRGAQTETEYVSALLGKGSGRVKRWAQRHLVHVWLVAHPKSMEEWDGGPPTMYDISGSAHWYNKADMGIVVHSSGLVRRGLFPRAAASICSPCLGPKCAYERASILPSPLSSPLDLSIESEWVLFLLFPALGGPRGNRYTRVAIDAALRKRQMAASGRSGKPLQIPWRENETLIKVLKGSYVVYLSTGAIMQARNKTSGAQGDYTLEYDREQCKFRDPLVEPSRH